VMKRLFGMPDIRSELPVLGKPIDDPALNWRDAYAAGQRLAEQQSVLHGFKLRHSHDHSWLFYDPRTGLFAFAVHTDNDVGRHNVGATIFIDGTTGGFRGIEISSGQNMAATFTSWITAIHNCTVGGLPMQIVVSLTGLLATALSVTGVYLWWIKRKTAHALLSKAP